MSESHSGKVPAVRNKTILTPTSGFLGSGFTHTINAYQGCAFAGSALRDLLLRPAQHLDHQGASLGPLRGQAIRRRSLPP